MNEDNLYIKLEQIPGGVRLEENYSSRFVECIQADNMHDSMLFGIADNCGEDHLFERGDGQFYDELVIEGSLPIQTAFSYSVEINPINSVNLDLIIYDNLFKHIKATGSPDFTDPAALTAAAFAETIYGELYFPALKLLTGDKTNEKIKSFVGNLIDELYVPFV